MATNMDSKVFANILRLKEKRQAIILAHSYQSEEVQQIADYVGDSFGLSVQAKENSAQVVVFCGVHFMAESAYILAPHKTILLPEKTAGCPLADTIDYEGLQAAKAQYPNATVVCYINSSAKVKSISDICCTSSNALQVITGVDNDQILFVPDKNLAHYVAQHTKKQIIPWAGACVTHQRVSLNDVALIRQHHPDAVIAVHPECEPEIVDQADFVGSTTAIIQYAVSCTQTKVVIGTEMGVVTQLKAKCPTKTFYLLAPGLVCPNMKKTRLQSIEKALIHMETKITVSEDIRIQAKTALERMLTYK